MDKYRVFFGLVIGFLLINALSASAQIPVTKITASATPQANNRPYNTLSVLDATRWSALGDNQWIQYDVPPDWRLTGGMIDWYLSAKRTGKFEIAYTVDGSTWVNAFSGDSIQKEGPQWFEASSNEDVIQAIRITGHGTTANLWNSVQSVVWWGWRDRPIPSTHFWDRAETDVAFEYDEDLTSPASILSNYNADFVPVPANTGLDLYIIPYNTSTDGSTPDTAFTRCIGIWFDQPSVPFTMTIVRGDQEAPLLQETSGLPGFQVYHVPADAEGVDPYDHYFRLVPAVDAHVVEMVFLFDCNDDPAQKHVISAEASTFQTTPTYNPPTDSVDGNPSTRWSALGDGQTIDYEVPLNTYDGFGMAVMQGDTRTATVDVQGSLDGISWYAILPGLQTQATAGMAWYPFGRAVYAQYLRIVGRGNTKNLWNSIVDVSFRQDSLVTN